MSSPAPEENDVIIVGAGQYGLALGYELKRRGLSFVILEANGRVGDSWRNRYDSLVLFSPNTYNSLPGLQFPGDPHAYPTKDEVGNYLESYATIFSLPVVLYARVNAIKKIDGGFEVHTGERTFHGKAVVLATGAFQEGKIGIQNDGSITSIHSSEYKNPSSVSGNNILVVGAGNSAVQIAEELSQSKHVTISMKGNPRCIRQERFGKNFLWWAHTLGILHASPKSFLGRWLRKTPLIGCQVYELIKEGKIKKVGEAKAVRAGRVYFSGGEDDAFDFIVFATGFVRHIPWIDEKERGVFSIGVERGRRNSSGLLAGVSIEAREVAEEIEEYSKNHAS